MKWPWQKKAPEPEKPETVLDVLNRMPAPAGVGDLSAFVPEPVIAASDCPCYEEDEDKT